MSAYQSGQRAALEKIGVFVEFRTPSAVRAPHVRAQGANLQEVTSNAIANINRKYSKRAPKASNQLAGMLQRTATALPTADVKRLRIGHWNKDPTPNAGYNTRSGEVHLGVGTAPEGTLAHEYGHAVPVASRNVGLDEEARATTNYINAMGRDHEDVPSLLQAFGTYLQEEFPPPKVTPAATAIQENYGKKLRDLLRPAVDRTEYKTLQKRQTAATMPLRKAKSQALSELAVRYDKNPAAYAKRRAAVSRYYDPLIYEAGRPYTKAMGRLGDRIQRQIDFAYNRAAKGSVAAPTATLADYAKLQGGEREQLDSWISSMRDKIDQYFWEGAGNTALEPILAEIERLRR